MDLNEIRGKAILITNGLFTTSNGKTAHGLVRGTERFEIIGLIDKEEHKGLDAGELLDGVRKNIPVFGSLKEFLFEAKEKPEFAIIGTAFHGGRFPVDWEPLLLEILENQISIVNGLHELLNKNPLLVETANRNKVHIYDVREPKPFEDLHFWTGEILRKKVPTIASLGIDCAVGKMTTCRMLMLACNKAGIKTEMIYTGQTGWMQGYKHGFLLDATLNDFVSGELEFALLECIEKSKPDLILLEGQSALRNPAGPCGSELLLSGNAKGAILQYTPFRKYYDGTEKFECVLPSPEDEIALIKKFGSEPLAITLNGENATKAQLLEYQNTLSSQTDLPVISPLYNGVESLIPVVQKFIQSYT